MNFSPNLSNKWPIASQSGSRLRCVTISSSRMLFGGEKLISPILSTEHPTFQSDSSHRRQKRLPICRCSFGQYPSPVEVSIRVQLVHTCWQNIDQNHIFDTQIFVW